MIRLSRTVWIQLSVLTGVTVISGGIMAFGFVKVPALLGIGRYTVAVDMPASGGLYPTSVVTYRGTEIGRVRSIDITRTGVRATLTLNSSVHVNTPVSAAVHSRSAIGEQFLELRPSTDPGTRPLRDGDVIPAARVQIPADIAGLLDATNKALKAIPQENLRTVVEETDKAISGLGPELSRIVDGSTKSAIEADRTKDSITGLIDQSGPVLDSQARTADSIRSWAEHVAAISGQFKAQDKALTDLLQQAGPSLREGKALFDRVSPTLPVLLANMVSLGSIAMTYRSDIEQLLVLFPQGTAVMSAIAAPNAGTKQAYRGIYLDFNLNLNLPPPCNAGFLPVTQQRSPAVVDAPDRPAGELYCRVPQDSPLNVRGVRNIPCETAPGKRAATAETCEGDDQYVPLNDGWNWKGDPNATLSGQAVPQSPSDTRSPLPVGPATSSPAQTWEELILPPP